MPEAPEAAVRTGADGANVGGCRRGEAAAPPRQPRGLRNARDARSNARSRQGGFARSALPAIFVLFAMW
ncbi:MAG: hypothetical protein BAA02_14820 [Paenibacillaceae bacterium ZCTH02-B3]|nr:MAG: hypothetical protein BAA02_14820 [Paenibacillaceae bacterium ZCTH02-B3]